ncbi:XRE family transcriptional regulator [Kiloniella laminariae]|uniref:XRE family transcriptional regulator n=1 Tax=Kiloniella laminariae TaxID=454162 RepID=A0ABT4LEX8_9PROT|nr:XRE family transcriptional regulator [Kiloniella laminariae]MCZ4279655.1 XRE family transcriptional regulator [Kiloniella laminariae]
MKPIELIAATLPRERQRAGLSLSQLAKQAGIAKSTLSQLESGAGNPALETLWALATALNIPVSRLIDAPQPTTRLIRAGEGPRALSSEANYIATLLSSCPPSARRDIFRVCVQPGQARDSAPHPAGTMEHVILCSGRALVGPLEAPVELAPGDYFTYPGDRPHTFKALAPDTSAVLMMESI